MEGELQLALLGEPRVSVDGVPLRCMVYKKSLALLCYLAVSGGSRSREVLAGLLWGEATQANARAGLRKALADLRRPLAAHLVVGREEVSLDDACPRWLDVEVLEGQLSQAMRRGGPLADGAADGLAHAVELYRGDFLAGFYVRRAPAFEEWALLQRERLRLCMLRALQALAAHYAASGAYGPAIAYTTRLLALEPAQEEAHRLMMSLLARSGQRDAALRQYQACRRALAALGVEPEEETRALYAHVQRAATGAAGPFVAKPNLPVPLTPLLGREKELSEIAQYLRDPAYRLVTLVGPGGSGKTHLAQVVAAVQVERFAHGACWVPLDALDSPADLGPADTMPRDAVSAGAASVVAQALGLSFHGPGTPREQLLSSLRHRHALLVVDGAERLLARPERGQDAGGRALREPGQGVDLLLDILRTAPRVKVLVTSRARLNLGCEQIVPVGGLACPVAAHSDPPGGGSSALLSQALSRHAAPPLFLAGARRARPDFELAAGDLAHVARICRYVGGLPLAILLAASWAEVLTPAEIAARLCDDPEHSIDFLAAEWHDLPARQRSMRAVFDASWRLLTARQREVIQALSVSCGGRICEAVQEMSRASPRALMGLVEASFLRITPQGSYEIPGLLRQYIAEKAGKSCPRAARCPGWYAS